MFPENHRIYSYLNEPIRIIGLTLDELALTITAIAIGLYFDHGLIKLASLIFGILGVMTLKRYKKLIAGFSLKSFLYWHLGIRGNLYYLWPQSHKRMWLS